MQRPVQTCPSSYIDAVADEHDAGRLTAWRSLLECSYMSLKCKIWAQKINDALKFRSYDIV